MDLFDGMLLFVNFLVGLVFGVTISKSTKKNKREGPSIGRLLSTYSIIAIVIGVFLGVVTLDIFTPDHYKTISDILVSLFGFSGLIFTFLMGNILRNESEFKKNIRDYEIKRDEALLVSGRYGYDMYQEKIDELVQSLAICKRNFKRAMILGLSSIGAFFVSLFCVILEPYYAKFELISFYPNVGIFVTMFLGFIYLFISLAYLESPSPENSP